MIEENLLIGITASMSVMGMPTYLLFLKETFSNIKVIMTECSQYFISKEAMSLIEGSVYTNMFPLPSKRDDSHVSLAEWVDLFIVLPATAHILAEVAHGFAGSLLSATILSNEKPVIFFPNMNDSMWLNPATQKNVSLLKSYGHIIIPPVNSTGYQYAQGKKITGGFMPMPQELIAILKAEIDKRRNKAKSSEEKESIKINSF